MIHLKKYNEEYNNDLEDLSKDIEDILLEFSDDSIDSEVMVVNNEIQIYIGAESFTKSQNKFYLDDEKKNAIIRIIRLSEEKWIYKGRMVYDASIASTGSPKVNLYIYDDARGLRIGGKSISDKYPISYIRIFLYSK